MAPKLNGTNGSQNGLVSGLASNNMFRVPEWLNEHLFLNLVKELFGESTIITNFTVTPAVKPGENYSSIMFRVTIEMDETRFVTLNYTITSFGGALRGENSRKRTVAFILKTNHNDQSMLSLLQTMMLFPKEQEMYDSIIPKFESLYRDAGTRVFFAPRSFKLSRNIPVEYVLLADICRHNFRTANRLVGLNMAHMKKVLAKLAQFHAASACLHERSGSYGEKFMYSIFTEKYRSILMTLNSSEVFLSHLKKWKNCAQYAEILAFSDTSLVDRIIQAAKFNSSEFNVLNHGDFWCNNIMFEYDAFGQIKETCFIDFQVCKYGSPAYDLYYFILTSAQMDIKLSQFDHMIKFYHDNLITNLQLLKYQRPLPKLKNLHMSLLRNGLSAYLIVSQILPVVLMDVNSLSQTDREDDLKLKTAMYSNLNYIKSMEAIMPWMDNRGLLDFS